VGNRTGRKMGAILAAGGGIAGMQASLDVVAAGFKVHLVERDISMGGVMPQEPITICAEQASKIQEAKGERQ
jgi:heterodisulfide reductase subunit A-like polyferredoxin